MGPFQRRHTNKSSAAQSHAINALIVARAGRGSTGRRQRLEVEFPPGFTAVRSRRRPPSCAGPRCPG